MSTEQRTVPGTVWVVHCIDTEGPLEESLDATFERINARFGLELPASYSTLAALQRGEIDVDGREDEIAVFAAPARLAYLSTWREVETMIERVTSTAFRHQYADPAGGPYRFSWFVIDVVGYRDNPRRKPVGFHEVWDRYQRLLRDTLSYDSIGWHFHAVPVGGHALEYNGCWTNNDYPEQSLARRLIQRGAFPSTFRAGGTIERNDLSHWLEQFIPFDFSCCSIRGGGGQPGQLWDWRNAPTEWRPYHPDWYDYRRPGSMHRWVFRCLEVSGHESRLSIDDAAEAFALARDGEDVVLAYTSHDRRDLELDVAAAVEVIGAAARAHPDVPWRFGNALDAARAVSGQHDGSAPRFTHEWREGVLWIEADRPLFGPAPFLAVEEEGAVYFRDNLTVEGPRQWAYVPPRPSRTRRIGIAGCSESGATGVLVLDWQQITVEQ